MTVSQAKKVPSGISRTVHLVGRHLSFFARHNTPRKFVNLCRLYVQRWTNRTVLSAHPIEIIMDPTNICNLRCPLCPTGQRLNSRPLGRMTFKTFQRIIDELAPWLYKIRLYSWGEPLLHNDLYRMIAYATERNIGTEISSHLNVFEDTDAEKLVESGLELLVVSMDGADPATYTRYRVKGDFEKACNNITAIVKAKRKLGRKYPVVEIQFLVMKHNESQIHEMTLLARKLGVDNLRLAPVTINLKNEDDRQWLPTLEHLSRYSYAAKKDRIYARRRKCEWLWRSAVVNWDETVSPCCVYEGKKSEVGSLEAKTFAEVWNNDHYVQCRQVFTRKGRRKTEIQTICSSCQGSPKALDEQQHGLY